MLEDSNLYTKTEWDTFATTDWQLVSGRLLFLNQEPVLSACRIEALGH